MSTRLTWIPSQTIKIVMADRIDLAQFVLGGIYIQPGLDPRARIWKVNADLSNGGELLFSNQAGKDDSLALRILMNGDVQAILSEALPGQSGSTAQPEVYTIPGVFPAYSAATGTIDAIARQQIAAVRTHLRGTP